MSTFLKWYRFRRVRPFGAAVYVHWSVLVVVALIGVVSFKSPLHAAVAIGSYLGVIVIHEFGHALIATRLGYEVYALKIGFIHGSCEHEEPDTELEHAWIAWGGVLAQLSIAIPVLAIGAVTEDFDLGVVAPAIVFLGYINLICALFNLAPAPEMDGKLAWRAVPLMVDWLRARRKTRSAVTPIKRNTESNVTPLKRRR